MRTQEPPCRGGFIDHSPLRICSLSQVGQEIFNARFRANGALDFRLKTVFG
jgi:hypothetical protein